MAMAVATVMARAMVRATLMVTLMVTPTEMSMAMVAAEIGVAATA